MLFTALFFLLSAFDRLHASPYLDEAPVYDCSINADLHGVTDTFFIYGRDAWSGKGQLVCVDRDVTLTRSVSVRFNSANPGIGAGNSSFLRIHLRIFTKRHPQVGTWQFFVASSENPDDQGSGAVTWRATLETSSLLGGVAPSIEAIRAKGSLSLGTLLIE